MSKNSQILFSVLIPAYKAKFLKECIDSVLEQTYENFELIILNDASPENIDAIVRSYSDPRIRYYKNQMNVGSVDVVDNWNFCLNTSRGEYAICMGDDDKLLPNCLSEYERLIKKFPDIGLLHGWTEIINDDSEILELTTHRCEFESAVSLAWHRWHAYALQFIGDFCFNTKYLKKEGGFYKLPLAWGSDDISAIIAAMKNGVANTQEIVFQYRRNQLTISSNGSVEQKLYAINGEERWYDWFLNQPFDNENDALYLDQMRKEKCVRFEKKRGLNLLDDIHSCRFRILNWAWNRRKYGLSLKSIVFALCKSF